MKIMKKINSRVQKARDAYMTQLTEYLEEQGEYATTDEYYSSENGSSIVIYLTVDNLLIYNLLSAPFSSVYNGVLTNVEEVEGDDSIRITFSELDGYDIN